MNPPNFHQTDSVPVFKKLRNPNIKEQQRRLDVISCNRTLKASRHVIIAIRFLDVNEVIPPSWNVVAAFSGYSNSVRL